MKAVERAGNTLLEVPVATSSKLVEGELAVLNADGYALPASKGTGFISAGVVIKGADNRLGENGAEHAEIKRGAFRFQNDGSIKETHLLKSAYIVDATTVTITETGSSVVGKILQVEDDGVTVEIS